MRISRREQMLVESYRLNHITLEELWRKLLPGRSFVVCLYYGIPWDARGLLEKTLPEVLQNENNQDLGENAPKDVKRLSREPTWKSQPRDIHGRWTKPR